MLNLRWEDIHFNHGKFGYVFVRGGKSKKARRAVSMTERAAATLNARPRLCEWIFPGDSLDKPMLVTSIDHQHAEVRDALELSKDFVVHSLRHTMLTRLGESGTDAFTIMRIAGHSSITISARYVHPSFESMERAIERLGNQGAHGGHTELRRAPANRRKSLKAQAKGA
jgi:integrase